MGQANAVTTANSNALITGASLGDSSPNASSPSYHIQFTLDADSPCEITVYYFAREEVSDRELK